MPKPAHADERDPTAAQAEPGDEGANARPRLPERLETQCPTCRRRTEHEVLAGRSSARTFQGTVRCSDCGTTHPATLRRAPQVQVPVVVSQDAESRKVTLTFRADDVVKVGDELFLEEGRVLVSAVEVEGGQRPRAAKAGDVVTVWTKAFDVITVKVNVTMGDRTLPRTLPMGPEDEIAVGDVLTWPDLEATVFSVKTAEHRIRKGAVLARDALRVYAKAVGGGAAEPVDEPSEPVRDAPRPPPRRR